MRISFVWSVLVGAVLRPLPAQAQPEVSAVARWEVSLDNGASWQGGVVNATTTQASALVRLRVGWTVVDPPPNPLFFRITTLDAVSESLGDGGLRDTITEPMQLQTTGNGNVFVASSSTPKRLGSLIKLDPGASNISLPGADTQWMQPLQTLTSLPGFVPSYDNPITILQYRLNLDGTEGVRELYGVFFRPAEALAFQSLGPPGGPILVDYLAPLRQTPATLIVPTPGSCAIVGCLLAMGLRRRR